MIANQAVWGKRDVVLGVIILGALLALYLPFLQTLVSDWNTNEDYSHGYFIPFLTLFFVYSIRHQLRQTVIEPNFIGIFVVVAGLTQLIVAKIGSEYFLQRTSFIVVLLGIVLFLFGWKYLRKMLVPLGYLIFMVPLPAIIWNKIAFPMQLFASFLTEHLVSFMGIPIFREGNVLHLSQTVLEVVAACSGLRSLVTMFALGAALAFMSPLPNWKKWLLFFSAIPVSVIANISRLTITAILASKYGGVVAQGFLHEFSGIAVFFFGLTLLLAVNRLLAVSNTSK